LIAGFHAGRTGLGATPHNPNGHKARPFILAFSEPTRHDDGPLMP
jgi:hypothetical protein